MVRKYIVTNMARRLAHIKKHWRTMRPEAVVHSVMSYYGWLVHADAAGLWRRLVNSEIHNIVQAVCHGNDMKNPLLHLEAA